MSLVHLFSHPDLIIHSTSHTLQEDNFVPVMTAMETATFAAEMLLPAQLSSSAKKARAREVLVSCLSCLAQGKSLMLLYPLSHLHM